MKTIKIIDLLNKIANGEELPTYIKVRDSIFGVSYKFSGKDLDYQLDNDENYLSDYICNGGISLNDEVEIIEEDKKIERITNEAFLNSPFGELVGGKFNEIIDYINKEEK